MSEKHHTVELVIRDGEPPKDGKSYVVEYFGGVISSAAWRYGTLGEPQQNELAWRSDCSGRFGTVVRWFDTPMWRIK